MEVTLVNGLAQVPCKNLAEHHPLRSAQFYSLGGLLKSETAETAWAVNVHTEPHPLER